MNWNAGESMKCTACGADMKGLTVCEACGKKTESPPRKVEVEYKDFKISELLEIRPKYGSSKEVAKPAYDDLREENILSAEPAFKKTFPRIIPIIIISALAAGVICLFHCFSLW